MSTAHSESEGQRATAAGTALPSPRAIAERLRHAVVGQEQAVREVAVAVSKKLASLPTGNILLVGSSGCGKTTLMRAVERFVEREMPEEHRMVLIRVHANVLAEDAGSGHPGEGLLLRLLDAAHRRLGAEASPAAVLDAASKGLVFVDEIDKIRARVGDRPNVAGIRAQEALLTLMEHEAIPVRLPSWAGGGSAVFDSRRLLFICAGAFEGLYDAVYDRVTVGSDRGALQPVTVVDGTALSETTHFDLRDWVQLEDLFAYGMTPQFLARFDATILLADLGEEALLEILLESEESALRRAREYFASRDIQLAVSPAAARRIAAVAAARPRLGARALGEVFRRVIRDYEFDPALVADGVLMIDLPEVEEKLGR